MPGCCPCTAPTFTTFITGTAFGCGNAPIAGATITITNPSTGATVGTGTTDNSGVYRIGIPTGGTFTVTFPASGNYQAYQRSATVTTGTTATANLFPDPIPTLHCCGGELIGDTLHATVGGYAVLLTWDGAQGVWRGDFTVATPHGVGTPDGACSNFRTDLDAIVPVRVTHSCTSGQGGQLLVLWPGHYGAPTHPSAFPPSESAGNYPWNGPTYINSTTGSPCSPAPWWERVSADSTNTSYTASPYHVQGYLNTGATGGGNGSIGTWNVWLFGQENPTWDVTA